MESENFYLGVLSSTDWPVPVSDPYGPALGLGLTYPGTSTQLPFGARFLSPGLRNSPLASNISSAKGDLDLHSPLTVPRQNK